MIALRLVLDTNVIVSAALQPEGFPRAAFLMAITPPARLYVTREILAEYEQVLARRELDIRKNLQRKFLDLVSDRSRLASPSLRIYAAPDRDDNKFLECCDEAKADYLVTGNTKHFPAFWKRTKVVTPRQLVEIVAPHLPL